MERLAGRIILLWGWRRALTAFLAGALAVLSQAPFDFFAVCLVSFPVLVWLLDGATSAPAGPMRRLMPAFATGWWFGFGYFLAGLWWIGGAVLVEADSFAWALPLAVVGIPALLALFYGLACAVARLVWSDGIGRIAALAFGFGLAEWLRTFLFTGFPWNAIGYAAMPIPLLMQSVSVVGMIGMNALAVFVFAMPALLASQRHLRLGVTLAALLMAAHVAFGYVRLNAPVEANGENLSVRIVQPSIDLSEKWDAEVRDRIFRTMLDLSGAPEQEGARPQLILWPETSVPFFFTERPDALVALGDLLHDGQTLIAGAMREEGASTGSDARYYNSVVAIDAAGEIVDAVDKLHLVPFGEYIPFADLFASFGLSQFVAGPMNLEPGNERHPIALAGGAKALPFICYEIIFPALVAVDLASTDIIVNVTNDAWFGDTPGPYQHFRQAQIRAVETGLPLIRAANTGISGVVDPRGRIVDALSMNARGVLDAVVPLVRQDKQMFWKHSVNGLVILFFFGAIAAGLGLGQRLRPN
ncbi:apolipoprotein N-acyltransferase [Mesorhizobium sp. KR2-14]|uniref:apolipoprotein N-acyltransferase n=1 Tax=Mesorhizobium sp. KR2-14 TaxID=3156610 RepID=UPI0032B577C6